MDERQIAIIMQNALGHAFNVLKHNTDGKKIKVDTLLAAATKIAEGVLKTAGELSGAKTPDDQFKYKNRK